MYGARKDKRRERQWGGMGRADEAAELYCMYREEKIVCRVRAKIV
jgi:hypothetical protein